MKNKLLGFLLILVALSIVLAMVVNNHILWLAVDLFAIVVCGIVGIILLKRG